MTRIPAPGSDARIGSGLWFRQTMVFLGHERAAQLLQFAFILPFLAVMTVGVVDFAQGFLLKQKLTNAAREGARIAAELSPVDLDQADPATVRSVRNAVVNYMDNANLDVAGIDSTPTNTAPAEWTFYQSGDAVIVIHRAVAIPVTGGIGSRVTVRYPFTWSFSDVIQLLVPSATFASSFLISTDVTMKNLVN